MIALYWSTIKDWFRNLEVIQDLLEYKQLRGGLYSSYQGVSADHEVYLVEYDTKDLACVKYVM